MTVGGKATAVILPIRLYGDPILRRPAAKVKRFDAELSRLIDDMLETVYAADGIGLAAPQVGVPLALFVALQTAPEGSETPGSAGQLATADAGEMGLGGGEESQEEPDAELTREQKRRAWGVVREHVLVNPVITARDGLQYGRDGCLSLPGIFVEEVPRDLRVRIDYQDATGAPQELTAEGYFAHVLQHEHDHLHGVLYFDHLPEPRRREFLEDHRAELAEMQRVARERLRSAAGSKAR